MWLMHVEQTDGVQIMHCRNRLEYRLQELPSVNVDGYYQLTNTVYEFFGYFWHGHTANRSEIVAP